MVKISKKERFELEEMGVHMGENGISRTYGHHKNYYMCESKDNLKKLNKIRNK